MAIFDEIVTLIIGVSWPLTVILLTVVLRREIIAAAVALRERISSADTGELTAGPVSLRWSGVIAAASEAIVTLPVETKSDVAAETRVITQLPAVNAAATPVRSIVDSYELVRVTLLSMLSLSSNESEYLVSADAGAMAIALRHAGELGPELTDAIQVLSDLRESMLLEERPIVSAENAYEYVNLTQAVLARLPNALSQLGGENDER